MSELIVMVGALNADLGIRVDRLPAPGETVAGRDVRLSPGGKASNQAVAAARLGGRVRLVGAVGDDENGRMLREHLARDGVDLGTVQVLPDVVTGQAIIPVDDAGENAIILVPGANGAVGPEDIPTEACTDAAVVCLSLEVPLPVVQRAAALAVAAQALVVLNPSPYQPLAETLLDATDVLIVNELEAAQLAGAALDFDAAPLPEPLAATLAGHGIARAVVTRGGKGAIVVDGGTAQVLPARAVDPVDTTGAGDAFTGTLARRLAAGDTLEEAAREASVVAAFSTTRRGAQASYPTPAELAAWR
ncbi:ribokinase [Gryllotalpicola ginsengisoli]|uniref:ribokinase n=1 Tax=Gryllotalpicola ginsengisoli TaxID=444608 RepID=UPI0003B57D6A|nr:ribokinase [Gryllotalpicola ginsengisoli]